MRPVDSGTTLPQYTPADADSTAAPTTAAPADAPTQTPIERTDTAYAGYQRVVAERDRIASQSTDPLLRDVQDADRDVQTAQTELNAAIAAELGPQIDRANEGVPGQFQRPDAELITSFGGAILQRHGGDPAARAPLQTGLDDYVLQREAESVIPGFHGDFTPKDKLDSVSLSLQGKSPEIVERVLADPRVQQWIDDAATWIAEPYQGIADDRLENGAQLESQDASRRLSDVTANVPPEMAAQIIERSMPTIDKIARADANYGGPTNFENLSRALGRLGDEAASHPLTLDVARAMQPQFEKWEGFYVDTYIPHVMGQNAHPALTQAMAQVLREDGNADLADRTLNAAATGISEDLKFDDNTPLAQYNNAHSAMVEKDRHLAELLAKAGPLTPEQQRDFIQAFRNDPDNAAVYRAETEKAAGLAEYMDTNREAFLLAAERNPEAAQQLYDMMKSLKDTGQGVTALEFAVAIQSEPDSALAQAFSGFGDFQEQFTQDAIAAASSQLLVEHDGDANGAMDALMDTLGPLMPGAKSIPGGIDLKDGIEAMRQAANGEYSRLQQLTTNFGKLPGPLKGLVMAGVVFGAAGGTTAAQQEQYALAVNGFASAGEAGAKALASVTMSLADAGRLAAYGDSALNFAKFSTRLAPGLGLLASTAAAAHSGGQLFGEGDASYAVQFAGDVIGVLGASLENFPLTLPAGLVVSGIGALVSMVGGFIVGDAKDDAFRDEQRRYLDAAGIDDGTARDAMVDSDPEQVQQLLALGMTPTQLQDLAASDPAILASHHGYGPYVGELPELMARVGLDGPQLYDLLKAADAGGTPGLGIAELLNTTGTNHFLDIRYAHSRDDLIAALEAQASNSLSNPDQVRALSQAAEWLRTH